ncbi:hypothetical protein HDU96_003211 [Phlyctochytrium bullatum]|nr:hypothetical protein HDU96_003211 [Phlyctochytrium bullatum]
MNSSSTLHIPESTTDPAHKRRSTPAPPRLKIVTTSDVTLSPKSSSAGILFPAPTPGPTPVSAPAGGHAYPSAMMGGIPESPSDGSLSLHSHPDDYVGAGSASTGLYPTPIAAMAAEEVGTTGSPRLGPSTPMTAVPHTAPGAKRHASFFSAFSGFGGPATPAPVAVQEAVGGKVGAWAQGVEAAMKAEEVAGGSRSVALDGLDDDSVIQMLCDYENGFNLLLDRIKLNTHSCKEVSTFLKKRSQMEEDYGRSMIKLSQSVLSTKSEIKDGTFSDSWRAFVKVHERVGEIRMRYAGAIAEVAEEMGNLFKNTERTRKQLKESGLKQLKAVQDSETALDKAKSRYESLSEDWEKAILHREEMASSAAAGDGAPAGGAFKALGGLQRSRSLKTQLWALGAGSNPGKVTFLQNTLSTVQGLTFVISSQLQKLEEDARNRASIANETYKQQLQTTNSLRAAFYQTHLPRYVRMLKETNDSCDAAMKAHLGRHCRDMEQALMHEAMTLSPVNKEEGHMSVSEIIEQIDDRRDFTDFMLAYFQNNQKQIEKNDYQYSPYAMSPEAASIASAKNPIFGAPLITAYADNNGNPPLIVTKCIEAIEAHGLAFPGLYRVPGQFGQMQRLRTLLDRDVEKVNLDDWADNIAVVCGVLKTYFRELPEPLLPRSAYQSLVDAAKIEDARLRVVGVHEQVNNLEDAHYFTLKALMSHLWTVQRHEGENLMGIQNLAIIWGPTLMSPPVTPGQNADPADIKQQTRVVETILASYETIFVE